MHGRLDGRRRRVRFERRPNGLGEVEASERRLVGGEPVLQQPSEPGVEVARPVGRGRFAAAPHDVLDHVRGGARHGTRNASEELLQLLRSPPDRIRSLPPSRLDRLQVAELPLGGPRRQKGLVLGRLTLDTAGLHPLDDLLAALRELPHQPGRDTGDLAGVAAHRPPLHAQSLCQFAAHRRLEHHSGGPFRRVQRRAVERRPATVEALRHVGDEHVPMQVWVTEPGRAVAELGGDKPRCDHPPGPELRWMCAGDGSVVAAPAHEAGLPLQPAHRLGHRGLASGDHLALH
jgi:hypothetical protein